MSNTKNRGFASMDEQTKREIARRGGKAAHAKGTAHEFTSDEAREAGRKGGLAVSRNREHMAAIGRKGGLESGGRNRQKTMSNAPEASGGGDQPQMDTGASMQSNASQPGMDTSQSTDKNPVP